VGKVRCIGLRTIAQDAAPLTFFALPDEERDAHPVSPVAKRQANHWIRPRYPAGDIPA